MLAPLEEGRPLDLGLWFPGPVFLALSGLTHLEPQFAHSQSLLGFVFPQPILLHFHVWLLAIVVEWCDESRFAAWANLKSVRALARSFL